MKQSSVLARLSRLNILFASRPDDNGQEILRQIQRTRAVVGRQWPCPEKLGIDFDMVVCDFFPGIERRFAWMPGEATAAVVLIIPAIAHVDPDALHAALPDAILTNPAPASAILPALSLAWDHFSFHRRQTARINQLDENIRALREVERAKTILMQDRNIDEMNAFEFLRKEAMERRTKISLVAKQILDSRDTKV